MNFIIYSIKVYFLKQPKYIFIDLVILLLTFPLFYYVIVRAINLGFTHDESLTFGLINNFFISEHPFSFNLNYSSGMSGFFSSLEQATKTNFNEFAFSVNNNWLNTAFSYLSFVIFGNSEIALRLPNVIAVFSYVYFAYQILLKHNSKSFIFVLIFLAMLYNSYIVEFFSLSGGTGLALTFFLGSVHYALRHIHLHQNIFLYKFLAFSLLSIYSNYSFIIPVLSLQLAHIFYIHFRHEEGSFYKQNYRVFLAGFVLLLPAVINIIILQQFGNTDIGGNSLVNDSWLALNKLYLYNFFTGQDNIVLYLIFFLICVSFLFHVTTHNFKFISHIALLFFTIVTFLNVFAGVAYPIGKSAIYWIILLYLFFHVLIENTFSSNMRIFSSFIVGVFSVLSLSGFISNYNTTHSRDWRYDASTKEAVLYIIKDTHKSNRTSTVVYANKFFAPTMNYYIKRNHANIHVLTKKPKHNEDIQYFYLFGGTKINVHNSSIKKIKPYPLSYSKVVLLKKPKLHKVLIKNLK